MTRPIDIIIVSHNTRAELLTCLASLHEPRPASVERVVVVDNASGDGSPAAARANWPAVSVVALDRNLGFGAANNVALRESQAEFVLFLNSDTVAPPGAIDRLLERLRARGAAAAGPRLVDRSGRPEVSFGRMLTPAAELAQRARVRLAAGNGWLARRYATGLVSRERVVDWVSGACLLARRDAVAAAGGFDERFFLYEEDVDLCAALRARGGAILFTPRATVVHLRGQSVGRSTPAAGEPSHYDASHVAFYDKHAPRWAPWLRRWIRLRGRPIG
jgi:hypothetical protein